MRVQEVRVARNRFALVLASLGVLSTSAFAAPAVEERVDVSAHVRNLSRVAPGAAVHVREFPVGPGLRESVRLTRYDIYAPDARIYAVDATGTHEVPRSTSLTFTGSIDGVAGSRLFVSVDPQGGALRAVISSDLGYTEITPPRQRGGMHAVASAQREGFTYRCAGEDPKNAATLVPIGGAAPEAAAATDAAAATTTLYQAVIGVDTDTELMSGKFGGSTTTATKYIADLFGAMNVMYERDLKVRLLQGTTFLRTGSDPWTISGGGAATVDQLRQFADYWQANYADRPRAVAVFLSGKGGYYSASGLGYINVLCNPYGFGYCMTDMFLMEYLAGDAQVVGHELGHNFGSPHTHCYTPPIDMCYGSEGGCYSGSVSCPSGGGTVMSYCNLTGCGMVYAFHPRTIDLLNPLVQAALGTCISPLAATCSLKGDVNGDGAVNVSDALFLVNNLFSGGPAPVCSGNVNGDTKTDTADILYLINYLFAGGPAPR